MNSSRTRYPCLLRPRRTDVVEVEAVITGRALDVVIRDFGRGVVPDRRRQGAGLGILIAVALAAHFDIRRDEPTSTTEVSVRFPI